MTIEEITQGLGIYIYAALVSRNDPGTTTVSLVQGYRIADNEDEVRGMAVTSATELKPGFSIDDIMVMRISDAALDAVRTHLEREGHED
jgi:hypothetical protein